MSGHLESKRKELSKQNGVIDPSELMQIWSTISRLDPVEMYSEEGELLAVKDMPKHIRQAISKITVNEFISEKSDGTEVSRRTRTDIQLIDKHPALNNIADVYGIRKNGTSELMREFLNANGVSITINQTINNDNRQVTYNQPALERVLEVVQDG